MKIYLDFAKEVIVTVFTLLFLPVSFLFAPADGYEAKNSDELKTSFAVVSDIHIEGNNFGTFKEYSEILNEVKSSKNNDALVFLGDNTMNGQNIESFYFYTALNITKPADNLIIAPGNHDYGNGNDMYDELSERFRKYANFAGCKIDNNYYYKIINGCYFVVLTTEGDTVHDMYVSDAQLEWLKAVVSEAKVNNNPFFVFSHHPVNYIENGSYDRVSAVLNTYDNVLFFCGHTHWALSEYSVYTENSVKCINIPKSTEYRTDGYETGIGAVVEVYKDEILVRFRDFDDGEWVEGYEYTFDY